MLPGALSLINNTISVFSVREQAQAEANIAINPITEAIKTNHTGYFSDPYHIPYKNNQGIYISGTTHAYLTCGKILQPKCADEPFKTDKYRSSQKLQDKAKQNGVSICGGGAGIHRHQSADSSWDAVVTLHIRNSSSCDGHWDWSVIVHAHPENSDDISVPPSSWIGDELLVGSFSKNTDANYDGKYFLTPEGKLYLVYQKQKSTRPKRDGVVAWSMDNPKTKTPGTGPTFLLLPDVNLNSENYVAGNDSFKLIETGNIRAINGKFVMAYSVGAYNHNTYKSAIAFSDTFLGPYRKVMKENPDNLWNSTGPNEVFYILQAEHKHAGWHYVGKRVLAPGVPTVADIGPNGWVLTFAGYRPHDTGTNDGAPPYHANHRRPFYVDLNVNIPDDTSVENATDAELRRWITPASA